MIYTYTYMFFYNIKFLSKLFNYSINIKENRYYKTFKNFTSKYL